MIELTDEKKYITYFHKDKKFDPTKLRTIIGNVSLINKPEKAFWGSPVNAEFGWKEWCQCEDFGSYDWNNYVIWSLEPNCKILRIDWDDIVHKEILEDYLTIPYEFMATGCSWFENCLDFKKLKTDGIVAVELMNPAIGHSFKYDLEMMFNSWDCESIVVLDETKIVF